MSSRAKSRDPLRGRAFGSKSRTFQSGTEIILSDQSRSTLQVPLANLSGEHAQEAELMMTGSWYRCCRAGGVHRPAMIAAVPWVVSARAEVRLFAAVDGFATEFIFDGQWRRGSFLQYAGQVKLTWQSERNRVPLSWLSASGC